MLDTYTHPMMLQILLPFAFIVLCLAGLLLYAYKKSVPIESLNLEGLSPEQIKKTLPARIVGGLSLLGYLGLRFSGLETTTLIYIFVLIPLSMIATSVFLVQIIHFKSTK